MNNEEKILAMLESIQSDVAVLKKDNGTIRADMAAMKKDNETRFEDLEKGQQAMGVSMEDLQKGQQAIRSDIAKVNHSLEPKINAVYEGLDGFMRRNEQADKHERQLEEHGHRLFALEQAVNK